MIPKLSVAPTAAMTLNIGTGYTLGVNGNLILPSSNFATSGSGTFRVYGDVTGVPMLAISTNNVPISWSTIIEQGSEIQFLNNYTGTNNLWLQATGWPTIYDAYTYGKNITCGSFTAGPPTGITPTTGHVLNLGGGNLTITNADTASTQTFSSILGIANGTVILANSSPSTTKTFLGLLDVSIGNLIIAGTGTGTTTTILGNLTFNNITSTNTLAHTLTFGANTTTTVSNWNVSGRPGKLVTVNSTNPGWQFNLHKV